MQKTLTQITCLQLQEYISNIQLDSNNIKNKKKVHDTQKFEKKCASLFLNFLIEIYIIETCTVCIGKSIVINDYIILNIR